VGSFVKIFDADIVELLPTFTQPLIETHCHLDYLNAADLYSALSLASQVGIERIITIAVSPENLQSVVEIASAHDQVWTTQGIHPHEAVHYTPAVEATIRANARESKVLAIGEIGLDYHYDHSDRQAQIKAFEAQLTVAVDLNLPIVVHSREADEDTAAILTDFAPVLQKKGVIHSFTSGLKLAERCLELGFHLGFNGICTFKNADNVRAALQLTPLERILYETDAPYLTPVPFRGKPNAPHLLGLVANTVAHVKGLDVEVCNAAVYQNSLNLFWTQ